MVGKSAISLSVIVPCYNAEGTVSACLASLEAQTLPELEVVCVNDGSTDATSSLLHQAAERAHGRIRVIDQQNAGTWAARRRGIDEARGELVGFVDADDTVEPDFAETLCHAAQATGADIVVCGYRRIDRATGRVITQELCRDEPAFVVRDDPGCILGVNTAVWNKAYRAPLLKGMPQLAHPPRALEDVCVNLLAYLGSSGPVAHAPRPLVNYMVHENSTVTSVTAEGLQGDRAALLDVRNAYAKAGADVRLLAALDAAAFEHLGVSMAFRLSAAKDADLDAYLDETTSYLDTNFPSWRRSPYLRAGYARSHNAAIRRLLLAHGLYQAHLMKPALGLYRLAISHLGIDVKW